MILATHIAVRILLKCLLCARTNKGHYGSCSSCPSVCLCSVWAPNWKT